MEHAGPRWDPDPYRVLGVSVGASQQEIARAYRRAVQRAHPDARPRDPAAAAARFQALTAAYDLLRDPGRRADYDRGHQAAEPSDRPPRPPHPAPAPRWRGPAFPPGPPPGRLIWAGPVHVEPPATAPATGQPGRGTAGAKFEDPMVVLGVLPGRLWAWRW